MLASLSLRRLPPVPADASNAVERLPAAIEFGRRLFADTRFSSNGAVSCASCHDPQKQFQGGLPVGRGAGTGSRRAMPIVGAGYSTWLFWDGRKDSLWAQALGPLEDAVEHGGNRTRYTHLIASNYRREYEAVFGLMPTLDGLPPDAGPNGDAAGQAAWAALVATLTNMCAELGGFTGIVEPDDKTVRFLRERRGVDFAIEDWMHSDADAPYVATIRIDAAGLSPMVARPGDPGRGLPLAELGERPRLDIAYGGSCTAGKREDFEQYHAVLYWAAKRGLRVAPSVTLYLQFGTEDVRQFCECQGWIRIFEAVGAQLLQPACGACANCGPGTSTAAEQVTVSAVNRNFPGRNGPGQVWLASPATVAASAIAGHLVSFDELIARP